MLPCPPPRPRQTRLTVRLAALLLIVLAGAGWADEEAVMQEVVARAALPVVSGRPLALVESPAFDRSAPANDLEAFERLLARVGYLEQITPLLYLVHHTDGSSVVYAAKPHATLPTATARRLDPRTVVAGVERQATALLAALGQNGLPDRVPLPAVRRAFILACFLWKDGEDALALRLFQSVAQLRREPPMTTLEALLPDIAMAHYHSGLQRSLQTDGRDWSAYADASAHVLQRYPEAFPYTAELTELLPDIRRMVGRPYRPDPAVKAQAPLGLELGAKASLAEFINRLGGRDLLPLLMPRGPTEMPRPYSVGQHARDLLNATLPTPEADDAALAEAARTFAQRNRDKGPSELALYYTLMGTPAQRLAAARTLTRNNASLYSAEIEAILLDTTLPLDAADAITQDYVRARGAGAEAFLTAYLQAWPTRRWPALGPQPSAAEKAAVFQPRQEVLLRTLHAWDFSQLVTRLVENPELQDLYAAEIPTWFRRHMRVLELLKRIEQAPTPEHRYQLLRLLALGLPSENRLVLISALQYGGEFRAAWERALKDPRLVAADSPRPVWEILTELVTVGIDDWRPDPYVRGYPPAMAELRSRIYGRMNRLPENALQAIPTRFSANRALIAGIARDITGLPPNAVPSHIDEMLPEDRLVLAQLELTNPGVDRVLQPLRGRITQVYIDPSLITETTTRRTDTWRALQGQWLSLDLLDTLRRSVQGDNIRVTWTCQGGALGSQLAILPASPRAITYLWLVTAGWRAADEAAPVEAIWTGPAAPVRDSSLPPGPGLADATLAAAEQAAFADSTAMRLQFPNLLTPGLRLELVGYRN